MASYEQESRGEFERLQAENANLREQNEELARQREGSSSRAPRYRGWRWALAIALLLIGGVALVGAVPALWTQALLLDTDRYVETVTPLAEEPAIRASVSESAVTALFAEADIEDRTREALPPEAAFLATPLTSELRTLALDASERALATPQFEQLWTASNRRLHEALVPLLTGEGGQRGILDTAQGTVSLDISQVVVQVKGALVERGITIVEQVPDDVATGEIVLFQSDRLELVQSAVSTLQDLAFALPLVALVSLVGAAFAAPDTRRGVFWVGLTALVSMIVVAAAVGLARDYYLNSADRAVLSAEAAAVFFDVMVRFLRNAVRTVAAIGAVMVVGAALAGPSRAAVAVRSGVGRGLSGIASAVGLDVGPFSEWVGVHRRALEVGILLLLAVILLAAEIPTPGLVLGLAAAALLGFLVVELFARAHHPPPGTYRPVA